MNNITLHTQLTVWQATFPKARGYLGCTSLAAGTPHEAFFNYPEQASKALDWLLAEDAAGRNAYACAHLLSLPERKKGNAAAVQALYTDMDGSPLPEGDLAPSVVLETSPGHFHCWWVLTRAIGSERAERLNQRLALAIDADKSGYDLTQILRIVGTRNHKAAYAADPPTVQLRDLNSRTFEAKELERTLPPLPGKAEMPQPTPAPTPPTIVSGGDGLPGADYNRRMDIAAIIEPAGWTFMHKDGTAEYWCRPGKDPRDGHSARYNHDGDELFYVYSSGAAPFEEKTSYSKFACFAYLNHAGDFSAAARALAAQGYGSPRERDGSEYAHEEPIRATQPDPADPLYADTDATIVSVERFLADAATTPHDDEHCPLHEKYEEQLRATQKWKGKAAEYRDVIDEVRAICSSQDLDHSAKAPAIAFHLAGKFDRDFSDAHEQRVNLYFRKVTELTGLSDNESIRKAIVALDAGNLMTLSSDHQPSKTRVCGDGKPASDKLYYVQFGPREGEAPLTAQQRLDLLCHPTAPELQRRRRGKKKQLACDDHPTAVIYRRRQDYCTDDGELLREDEQYLLPDGTPTVQPLPPVWRRPDRADSVADPHGSTVIGNVVPPNGSTVTPLAACEHGPLAAGQACRPCDLSGCHECGALVAGTLYRYCRSACLSRRPDDAPLYTSPPAEVLATYGGGDS